MKKILYTISYVVSLVIQSHSATLPTNSPFKKAPDHWTNQLKWEIVFNVQDLNGIVREGNKTDSLSLHEALKTISESGGGVLYFPEGSYYFDYHLTMMDNVVLRGEMAENGRWLTKFIFPRYVPTLEGNGTPDHTAFKTIRSGVIPKRNFGLVDIDISGAVIDFKASSGSLFHDNIILYRVRQNNAALLDPRFPSKIQEDEHHAWQRWPLWNGDNMGISVENNILISECRINDSTTYNFPMPNYMTDDGYVFQSDTLYFRYDLHTGIIVTESNNDGNKDIEISNNNVYATKSRQSLYLHPGIAFYIANKENEKDKEIINDFIKVPKSRASTYEVADYIHIYGNVVKDIEEEKEVLLVDRRFHYSNTYQNNVQSKFKRKVFTSEKSNSSLTYFLMSPEEKSPKEKYPLIIFFHGVGEIGAKNPLTHFVGAFASQEITNKYPCYIVAPHLMNADESWEAKGSESSPSIRSTIELIEYLRRVEKLPIDSKRIYLAGISYGGAGVFEVLTKFDDFAAAAVVMSFLHRPNPDYLKKWQKVAFQFTAGRRDSKIPIAYMHAMVERYKIAGLNIKFDEYDIGHFSWIPLLQDPEFYEWLFSQRR